MSLPGTPPTATAKFIIELNCDRAGVYGAACLWRVVYAVLPTPRRALRAAERMVHAHCADIDILADVGEDRRLTRGPSKKEPIRQ